MSQRQWQLVNICSHDRIASQRQNITQGITNHATRTTKVQHRIRHDCLLDLRYHFRSSLLGILCVHASTHQQRTVLNSVWSTSGMVMATGWSTIHGCNDSHVKSENAPIKLLWISSVAFHLYFLFVLRAYVNGSIDKMWWCNVTLIDDESFSFLSVFFVNVHHLRNIYQDIFIDTLFLS